MSAAIKSTTGILGVIGWPIAHSRSPAMHNAALAALGLDLVYLAFAVREADFDLAVDGARALGVRGLNVTVPHKEAALRLSDSLTPRAQRAGAVNTLASAANGKLLGDNTDGAGLVRDLTVNLGCKLRGARVLLLGAGGAARGVILPLLLENPAELVIANRTEETAARLALEFARLPGCAVGAKPDGTGFGGLAGRQFDLVINATSAGLSGAVLPLPTSVFAPRCVAYEMVYGRATPFMQQAGAAGARVADGLGMLVEQAAEAFFIWRGVRPHTAQVLAALNERA